MTDPHVLTVRNPWAWAIATGEKDVENRTWLTHFRGPIAIHAGLAYDMEASNFGPMMRLMNERDVRHSQQGSQLVRGAIVAVGELVDVVRDSDSRWAMPDCYHWLLANVRPLATPIPYKGSLSLSRLADRAREEIEKEVLFA
ncbi:ASCH domain-containing protein [Agromyces atrinae]|uniref:ASCH domain-containing protein n=1 Tax=Agromyces atrinae TaxID=592376 RepID=UPI001F5A9652|nr:ASCH domain-containing protein [Agromyces atrinae]MCI2958190.1 ASCH domain-containing protein [Agromyces atrinae]